VATAEEIVDALWRAGRAMQAYRELPSGLRRSHLYVLHALERLGGTARVTDIAAQSLVAMPNATKILKETDAAGWTRRSVVPEDKRTLMVSLTPAGSECLDRYYWKYLDSIAAALDTPNHPEYDDMIQAIDRVLDVVDRVNRATGT
jgi:DNA-binding MarR family transcriptional regulator